jgi:two-component system phosphate regulon sensor histidine kinase PhoR
MGALLVLQDVTQLRRLENMRRDFAANVSHEIKTPLTAIKGFVETLHHDDLADPEETRRFMGIIQRHVDRLSVILDDLMELSRIERDDELRQIRLRQEHLETILETAIRLCQPRLREKDISVDMHFEPNLTAFVDPTLMEQALVNLIDNAVKYSSAGSRIGLETRKEARETVIVIRDEGIGIARKHLPRLFERFYRVDKARSRKLGGTGLGLAIVKHIVQAHHGRVTVDSVLGQGSTFRIHLPIAGGGDGN